MRYKKYPKLTRYPEVLARSGRRVAAARKSVAADVERNALTPDLVRFATVDERLDSRERSIRAFNAHMRRHKAAQWLEARRRLRAHAPEDRKALSDYWQQCSSPASPEYLLGIITNFERGQFDPEAERRHLERIREQALGGPADRS